MWKFVVLAIAALVGGAEPAPTPPAIGAKVPDFTARDVDGRQQSLSDFKNKKAIAIVFIGTECPLSNLYILTLKEMHEKYASQGVQILAVNSNDHDTYAEVVAHAKERHIPYPVWKDLDHSVADALGGQRTPESFLLDSERIIRYRGRIDDQYGYRHRRASPSKTELKDAIDALLAGKPISVPETKVEGCVIGRIKHKSDSSSK